MSKYDRWDFHKSKSCQKNSGDNFMISNIRLACISAMFALIFLFQVNATSQFAFGVNAKTDLYSRYANPEDGISSRSAGSALLNLGVGPKVWMGTKSAALSVEATAVLSPFALSLGEFKGLGAVAFPMLAKLNFGGLTTLDKDPKFGFAIGGGVQWSRTELFGLKKSFKNQGGERSLFRTYVVEADFGYGLSGFNIHGFVRYGWNNGIGANTFNFGVAYDFNIRALKEYTDPEF